MEYTMRKLCSKDIFPMSKILSKIGMKELKTCFNSEEVKKLSKDGKNAEAVGMAVAIDVVNIILANLSSCESEIYKFLSDLTGAKVEDLMEDSLADFAELIIAIVQKEEFKDFFGVVSKLLK